MIKMKDKEWDRFYKPINAVANVLYEPLISMDKKVFCMNWNPSTYFENKFLNNDLREYWFLREIKFLLKLRGKSYIPEVIDIAYDDRQIFFRWYDNKLLSTGNWREQITEIKTDLENEGIFKINLYPHTCYVNDDGQIHIMDMYGCTDIDSKWINTEYLKPLMLDKPHKRFTESITGTDCDTHKLYAITIQSNYAKWPGDFLNA